MGARLGEFMFTLKTLIAGAVGFAIIAAVAGTAGWWFFVREDNKLATNAPAIPSDLVQSTATASSTTDDPPAASGGTAVTSGGSAFTIIPERSEAAYFADEKLAALSVPSKAKGSTTAIEGTFFLTEDGFELDPSRTSQFTVDLTTLKSDKDMRDRRVQNEGLNTSQFPTATFVAKSVSGVDQALADGEEHTFQLAGTLDLHGVQKDVTWEVKARRDGNVMTALATTNFLFEDFGIPVLNIAGFVSVQEDVTLQVQIVAQTS
jgi:polyisoprenoid-binding protein YceI